MPVIPDIPDPYVGTVLNERYRIQHKIGAGGMGAVYLAEHIVIERKVAIKILSQDFATKADLVQRFIQEARAAARIGHDNIVEVYDFGETASGSVFFAMEYLDGRDLASLIQQKGALQANQAKPIVSQICKALWAAHSKGIVHRDLKPENIYLIDKDGQPDFVKILDFGIAKINNVDDTGGGRLTRAGMIFGTPEYMSPEQARGEVPDHRVDIYALGCIIYEMLTGRVPFQAESFMGTLTKHMFEPVEPPSRRARYQVPPDLEAICLKAMEKDRDRRFQTMQEMGQAVDGEIKVQLPGAVPMAASSGIIPAPAGVSDPSLHMRRGQVPAPPPSAPSMPPQMYPPGMGMPPGYGVPQQMAMGMSGPVVMAPPNSGMYMQPPLPMMPPGRPGAGVPGYTTAPPTSYEVSRQPHAGQWRRMVFILGGATIGVAVLAGLLFWPTGPVGLANSGTQLQPISGTGKVGKNPKTAAGPALILIKGLPDSRVLIDFKDAAAIKANGEVLVETPAPGTPEWSSHIKVTKDGYGEFSTRMLLRSGNSYTVLADQPKKRR